MTPTLFCGGQLVMLPKFDPQTFTHALEKYKPSFLHLAPPLLAFCADNAMVKAEALQRLHHVMTAAAPTGPTLLKRFKEKAPSVFVKEGITSKRRNERSEWSLVCNFSKPNILRCFASLFIRLLSIAVC